MQITAIAGVISLHHRKCGGEGTSLRARPSKDWIMRGPEMRFGPAPTSPVIKHIRPARQHVAPNVTASGRFGLRSCMRKIKCVVMAMRQGYSGWGWCAAKAKRGSQARLGGDFQRRQNFFDLLRDCFFRWVNGNHGGPAVKDRVEIRQGQLGPIDKIQRQCSQFQAISPCFPTKPL